MSCLVSQLHISQVIYFQNIILYAVYPLSWNGKMETKEQIKGKKKITKKKKYWKILKASLKKKKCRESAVICRR